ncbi:MAG: hypothetical protein AB7F74_11470 [Parvibaculaceae bacterium]
MSAWKSEASAAIGLKACPKPGQNHMAIMQRIEKARLFLAQPYAKA